MWNLFYQEFDVLLEQQQLDPAERLARQRAAIKKRLGERQLVGKCIWVGDEECVQAVASAQATWRLPLTHCEVVAHNARAWGWPPGG